MARRTYPRSQRLHNVVARNVLARHEANIGTPVTLPVPIDLIIERTFELEILWDELAEPPDTTILGALAPTDRRIILNTKHQSFFEQWLGPERFTLAHELAHWIYDAEDPNQLALDFDAQPTELYCYRRDSPGLPGNLQLREVNANKLAANLLLPEHLVLQADIDQVLQDIRSTAAKWRVSRKTLEIRLQELGLVDEYDAVQTHFQ